MSFQEWAGEIECKMQKQIAVISGVEDKSPLN